MICFLDVSHSVASTLSLRLIFLIDGTVCVYAHLYIQYIPESVRLISDNRSSYVHSVFCIFLLKMMSSINFTVINMRETF